MTPSESREQQSDERWLDALAGRASSTRPDAAAEFEARLLRTALEEMREPFTAALSAQSQRALLEQLLQAAANSPKPKPAFCPACRKRWTSLLIWLAARPLQIASLAGLGLLFVISLRPLGLLVEEAPVERAVPASRTLLLRDAQPKQRWDALAQQLSAAGAEVRRYERFGRFGLDAQFALPLTDAASRLLHKLEFAADPDGVLRVEIEEATP